MDFKQFYKTINFDIDNEIRTVFQATQGDTKSRGLLVDLIVGGVKTPVTTEKMTFYALKPDGTRVMTVGVKDGTGFRIDFTNQTFAVPGVLLCTLVLSGTNGEKIADKKFKMTVDSSLEDGAIISEDERGILDWAFDLAQDIMPRLEALDIEALEHEMENVTVLIPEVERAIAEADTATGNANLKITEMDSVTTENTQRIDTAIATNTQLVTESIEANDTATDNAIQALETSVTQGEQSVATAVQNAQIATQGAETATVNATSKIAEMDTLKTDLNQAETSRVQAENGRTTAETARVEAETTRAGFYDGFNTKLNSLDKDIKETSSRIPEVRLKTDTGEHPGAWVLQRGDTNAGFYGFVQPDEMGEISVNPEANRNYSGANLALALGLASGTAFNSDVPLMKFHYKGKVLFIPLTGYRHSATWDSLYSAGLVYGVNSEGLLPPTGRIGTDLSIDSTDNSINCTVHRFLGDKSSAQDYADTVGTVGDRLVLKGWTNDENNKTVTIVSITDTKIIVSGTALVTETGGKQKRFYNSSKAVNQNKIVTIGGKQYRVRLMKGAGDMPTDSYADDDRGAAGPNNEWNRLILPLHERAKLGNWNYPAYAVDPAGVKITSDWGIGLTDENLKTHYDFGTGSYTWCQEPLDTANWRRVVRGSYGASHLGISLSWFTSSYYCWRPVLESIN